MSYYMAGGDYARRGGYYRGDGFWSSLAKGIPGALKFGAQLMTGNVTGAVQTLTDQPIFHQHASTAGAGSSSAAQQLPSAPSEQGMYASHAQVPSFPGKGAHPAALATIGAGAVGPHMHISKRTGQVVKGRRPRMNPLNVKALRRGIRRAHAFARIARSIVTFAKHGHAGVKFKGRFGGHSRKRLKA